MTITPDTHYQVLEIELGASHDEIKKAYKDLAKVWHPDRFAGDPKLQKKAEEKLKRINAAYAFLKSYQSQITHIRATSGPEKSAAILPNCAKLDKLLELGNLKDADYETKRLLLELASREKEGWLRPEDVEGFSSQALLAIDQVWTKHTNGRFGFSTQREIWCKLRCDSSGEINLQTVSENKFGQAVHWREGNTWVSPWDSFNYDLQAPRGSLPRGYIFILSGWWSYSKGWTGYLLLRFDDIFLKL